MVGVGSTSTLAAWRGERWRAMGGLMDWLMERRRANSIEIGY
jgi:hypothetical protein